MKVKRKITYRQAPNATSIEVPEGLVVYIDEAVLHYLNPTAAAVFLLCATPLVDSQVAQILQEEYRLEEPPLDDVRSLLEELLKAQVVLAER